MNKEFDKETALKIYKYLKKNHEIEEKQGFLSFQEKYFNPYGDPLIKVKLP